MPGDLVVVVSGARETARALLALPDELDQAITDAEVEGAALVATAMRGTAPRRTGRLASSVGVFRAAGEVGAGASVEYLWPVVSGVPGRRIPANPFPFRAAELVRSEVEDRFESAVDGVVERVHVR